MARPLRIEFTGAQYRAISRGDGQEDIYLDEACLEKPGGLQGQALYFTSNVRSVAEHVDSPP
jgi:hypothetical protein